MATTTTDITGAACPRTVNVLVGFPSQDGKDDMRNCVTHHHACDCREQMFAEMAAENKTLKKRLEYANGKLSEAVLKMDELRDIIRKPNG